MFLFHFSYPSYMEQDIIGMSNDMGRLLNLSCDIKLF